MVEPWDRKPAVFQIQTELIKKSVFMHPVQGKPVCFQFFQRRIVRDVFFFLKLVGMFMIDLFPGAVIVEKLLRPLVIRTDVWKEFGFNAVVYLAALTGISPSLYEAAAIDGAGRWKRMWHITLPGLKQVIVLMTILALGNILNAGFDQIYNLYNAAVYSTGDIIDTWVYRVGLNDMQFSLATAVGLLKSVVGFLLISVSYLIAYKKANYRIF